VLEKRALRRSRSGSDRKGAPGSALRPSSHVHNVKERGAGTGAVGMCVRGHARPHGATMGRTVELFIGWIERQAARAHAQWHRGRLSACQVSLNRARWPHETGDADRRVDVRRLGLRSICPSCLGGGGLALRRLFRSLLEAQIWPGPPLNIPTGNDPIQPDARKQLPTRTIKMSGGGAVRGGDMGCRKHRVLGVAGGRIPPAFFRCDDECLRPFIESSEV
jgi:hypothetical protein